MECYLINSFWENALYKLWNPASYFWELTRTEIMREASNLMIFRLAFLGNGPVDFHNFRNLSYLIVVGQNSKRWRKSDEWILRLGSICFWEFPLLLFSEITGSEIIGNSRISLVFRLVLLENSERENFKNHNTFKNDHDKHLRKVWRKCHWQFLRSASIWFWITM